MRILLEKIRGEFQRIISLFLYIVSLSYSSTLRIKIIGRGNMEELKKHGDHIILAFWHGAGFLPVWCLRRRGICLYTSILRDKNHQPYWFTQFRRRAWLKAFSLFGYKIVDASLYGDNETTGVIKFIKEIRSGKDAAIAVDGPNGPIYKAKEGAVYLAKKTGSVIVPVAAYAARRKVRFNQWDKLFVPRLFSKGALVFGKPIKVNKDASQDLIDKLTLRLESALNNLTGQARFLAKAY